MVLRDKHGDSCFVVVLVCFSVVSTIFALPETNSSPQKIGYPNFGKDRLPSTNFQGPC